jgi:hypothetical protein
LFALAVAVVVSTGCIAFSARELLLVVRTVPQAGTDVVARMVRARTLEAAVEASTELPPAHPVRTLLQIPFTASTRSACIADINEQLAELEGRLERGKAVPRAAARIALFAGVGAAVAELAGTLSRGGTASPTVFVVLLVGAAGTVGCAAIGRRADRIRTDRREAYGNVSDRLQHWVDLRFSTGTPMC